MHCHVALIAELENQSNQYHCKLPYVAALSDETLKVYNAGFHFYGEENTQTVELHY